MASPSVSTLISYSAPGREGLLGRRPYGVHGHRRMYVQDQDGFARVPWIGEGLEIGHVESGIAAGRTKVGT